ncbi:hypothetical protein LCGC14_2504740 [marine sediment metagenome]|uniref:Uncharacterized protein n=1 Tax=marine sediment metagenome TaxID=412755 RepID=A0A0F9DCK3_9ZZZZ
MAIGIKSRNFSPTKCEDTFEKSGFGWAPGQEKNFKGMRINKIKLGKGVSLAFGDCKLCSKFTGKVKIAGQHCNLPENEHCEK